jgi:uncharacterized protein (UPF0264 family)
VTGFLASVNSLEEAKIVLAGGADVIDLKDPASGVLGAAPLATIREVVKFVAGRRLVSATIGDLPSDPAIVGPAIEATWACGVDIVKVGLFQPDSHAPLLNTLAAQARKGLRIVVVMFADREPDFALINDLADCGIAGVMLDTADKQGKSLRSYCTETQLADFVRQGKALGLMTGLAGSLRLDDIEPLLAIGPDHLGFRGALCLGNSRQQAIEPTAVKYVRGRIQTCASPLFFT